VASRRARRQILVASAAIVHACGVATLEAGLDLEMPGPTRDWVAKLVAAVRAGEISATAVWRAALNVLRLMERCGALTATCALIRRAGADGMVLLANDGVLPLRGNPHVAIVGPNARVPRTMGGGSAADCAPAGLDVGRPGRGARRKSLSFVQGCTNHRFEPILKGPLRAE
jgi:beta-glucosidase